MAYFVNSDGFTFFEVLSYIKLWRPLVRKLHQNLLLVFIYQQESENTCFLVDLFADFIGWHTI